jgi:hypothetical protein
MRHNELPRDLGIDKSDHAKAAFSSGWYDARPDDSDRYTALRLIPRPARERCVTDYWQGRQTRNRT